MLTLNQIDIIAKKIVREIVDDLTDRSGLQNEWENFDEDIQDEIKKEWIAIVKKNIPNRSGDQKTKHN